MKGEVSAVAFEAQLHINGGTATIALSGELDASVAVQFRTEIEKAAQFPLERLVLDMQRLEYMASAGLRVLIFAKQKMGSDVELAIVSPQQLVRDTITATGFDHSVTFLSEHDVLTEKQ
jgi:anti-sigma B factor antagonist